MRDEARYRAFDELCGICGLTAETLEAMDGATIADLIRRHQNKPVPPDVGQLAEMAKVYAKTKRLRALEAAL